jgi:enoyl-CoA hydratase/carnithine racemase
MIASRLDNRRPVRKRTAWAAGRAADLGRALRVSLTGEFLDAATALRYGLVTEVVPHSGLLEAAHRLARGVLGADPPTCAAFLASARRIAGLDTEDAFQAEAEAARRWLNAGLDPAGAASRRAGIVTGNRGFLTGQPRLPHADSLQIFRNGPVVTARTPGHVRWRLPPR